MGMIEFIREFATDPTAIGAIAPSSRYLAREMIRGLHLDSCDAVLEFGPGTGAFTSHILEAVPKSCKFVAIEKNPKFATALKQRFPQLQLYEGSAADVRAICDKYKIEMADYVISGLPWATFPGELQRTLLDAMMRVLKPGGQFVTFAYLHAMPLAAARRFADTLPKYFSNVSKSRIVWANVPPAFVYRCRR